MTYESPSATCHTKDGEPLVLERVRAQGRVVARMLDMSLEQRFRNSGSSNVEVVYTFPLPWQAALLGLEVELNGETLTGGVKAKAQARTDYEDAVSDGHTGVLLSVNADGSHTLELGNLMAGETCTVRMHYVQVLQPEQGSLRLMLPTTLAPRYGDAIQQGRYEPHAVPKVSATVEYPFELTLNVEGELTQARIASPSHPVSIRSLPAVGMKQGLQTEIALARDAWLDRDFVLIFDQLPHASMGLASWDRLESGLGVVMASFSPALPEHHSQPVAMKLLVDCSGSMGGDSIQAALRALQGIVQGLKPGDRFSLSRFGSHVEHRSKALWKAAPAPLAAARRWIEQMDADLGGTEMESAIHSTLKLPGTDRADVLLITDGQIHDIDTVVEAARASRHRFFVVGIGTSASEGLLRRLADATGGACEFVAPGEAVESATLRLYQRMRSPTIAQPRVEWPQACQIHTASDLPRGVFDGDDITVFARLKAGQAEALSQQIRLYGLVDGEEKEVLLAEVQPAFIADEHNTLARLAAFQRHRQLSMGAQEVPVVFKKQLPALAEKYQLVTADTSMVLVKERADAERAIDMPELKQVEGMLAAGWGGRGAVFRQLSGADDLPAFSRISVSDVSLSLFSPNLPAGYRQLESKAVRKLKHPKRSERLRSFIDSMGDSDPQPTSGPISWQAPSASSRLWVKANDSNCVGPIGREFLTPAGLSHGLAHNPRPLWPSTYQALQDINVPPRVVEWLQIVLGATHDEKAVVMAFLDVMVQQEFHPLQRVAGVVARLLDPAEPALPEQQRELRNRLLSVMAEAAPKLWPTRVLDFAEPEFAE